MAFIFVISGPSGSGKTTLARSVIREVPNIEFSVSYTTRAPREGEKNGVDYFFVDRKTFMELVEKGEIIEWAEVYGELYGTSKSFLEEKLSEGVDIVLDIDTKGAKTLIKKGFDPITIFVVPPSLKELKKRIKKRGDDPSCERRLKASRNEIVDSRFYRHIVINDNFDTAKEEIKNIVFSYRTLFVVRKNIVEEVLKGWQE